MCDKPVLLNKYFKIVSFDGATGRISDAKSILNVGLEPIDLYSKVGEGFDMILEYTGPEEVFTLTHIAATPAADATSKLRTVGFWVCPKTAEGLPDVSYGSKFQVDDAVFWSLPSSAAPKPAPAAFFAAKPNGPTVHSVVTPVSGKFLHIRFVNSHGGRNIDIGQFGIVGFPGSKTAGAEAAPAAEATTSTKPSWFAATRPVTEVAENSEAWNDLVNAGAFIPALNFRAVNSGATAKAFATIGEIPVLLFISKLPVFEAIAAVKNGNATEDQKTVASLYNALALSLEGCKKRRLAIYLDTTSTTSHSMSMFARVPSQVVDGAVQYTFPTSASGPALLLGITDSLLNFADQDQAVLSTKGAASKAKTSLVDQMKNLSLDSTQTSLVYAIIGFSLALTDASASLKEFWPSAPAPENDAHPCAPNVLVATHETLDRLAFQSKRAALVVMDPLEQGTHLEARACVLAQVFARHGVEVDVVVGDLTRNRYLPELYPEEEPPIMLVTKATAEEVKAEKNSKKNSKKQLQFVLPKKQLSNLYPNTLTNADGLVARSYWMNLVNPCCEPKDEDEDEDPEHEHEHEHENRVTVPTPSCIVQFLSESGVTIPETAEFQADIATADEFFSMSTQLLDSIVTATRLARVQEGMKYALAADTEEGQALAACLALEKASKDNSLVTSVSATTDDAWNKVTTYVATLASSVGSLATLQQTLSRLMYMRCTVEHISRVVSICESALSADKVAELKSYAAECAALVGPALDESNLDEIPAMEAADSSKCPIVFSDCLAALDKLEVAFQEVDSLIEKFDADARKEGNLTTVVGNLTSVEQVYRVLTGFAPKKPVAAGRGRVKADPQVANAMDRLIVLVCTSPGLYNSADYKTLMELVSKWNNEAAQENHPANAVLFTTTSEVLENLSPDLMVLPRNHNAAFFFCEGTELESNRLYNAAPETIGNVVDVFLSSEGEGADGFGGFGGEEDEGMFEGFGEDEDEEQGAQIELIE